MDTDSFRVYIKPETFAKDVETRFNTSKNELGRPLPKGNNKNGIGLIKFELDGKIMKELTALRTETYSYLTDNSYKNKKAKGTKKCFIKRKLHFEDYKCRSLEKNKTDVKSFRENYKEFIKCNKLT